MYATVRTDPPMISPPTTRNSVPDSPSAASIAASFAGKPSSGGMPAIEAPEITATANVMGIERRRPDSSLMLRVPVRTSTSPTTMNSAALNTAWATRIEIAANVAFGVPTASSVISRPSCDTVPQARINFAST